MRFLSLCASLIFALTMPAAAQDAARRSAIVQLLNDRFDNVQFRDVGSPYLDGDDVRAIIEISPKEDELDRPLFLPGSYRIFASAGPDTIGRHLCTLSEEFINAERTARADFLDGVEVGAGAGAGGVNFEITLHEQVLEGIVRGILYLSDWASGEDRTFELLIAGSADAAAPGYANSLESGYTPVVANPPSPSDPTERSIFLRSAARVTIGDPYSNDELPLLRAEFMRRILLGFLGTCRGTDIAIPPLVLDVPPYPVAGEALRTARVYFYIHG